MEKSRKESLNKSWEEPLKHIHEKPQKKKSARNFHRNLYLKEYWEISMKKKTQKAYLKYFGGKSWRNHQKNIEVEYPKY